MVRGYESTGENQMGAGRIDRRQFVKRQIAAGFATAAGLELTAESNAAAAPIKPDEMSSKVRSIKKIVAAKPHMEGAGVHLHRGFADDRL